MSEGLAALIGAFGGGLTLSLLDWFDRRWLLAGKRPHTLADAIGEIIALRVRIRSTERALELSRRREAELIALNERLAADNARLGR